MAIDEERLAALAVDICRALPARDSFNLVIVTVPPADAIRTGQLLCNHLSCTSLDYDAKALELMVSANWDLFVLRERTRMLRPAHQILRQVAAETRDAVRPETPLVVCNINLPVTWKYPGFASDFYQLSSDGMVILVVGGSAEGHVRLHHQLVVTGTASERTVDLSS